MAKDRDAWTAWARDQGVVRARARAEAARLAAVRERASQVPDQVKARDCLEVAARWAVGKLAESLALERSVSRAAAAQALSQAAASLAADYLADPGTWDRVLGSRAGRGGPSDGA